MRIVKKSIIVLVAVVAVGALAVGVRLGWLSHRQAVVVRDYAARGFQMVEGCNGGAAVQADGQVYTIKQYLEDFSDATTKDTNVISQLQSALVVAQEKAQVLSEDCRRRGHCDTYPWKTNWATIKQALTAYEKSDQ
jgi:hypothetical protein